MLSRIQNTWRALTGRSNWERDLDDELRLHVDLRAADLIRSGVPAANAERLARLELGSRETYKEEVRAAFGLRWFDELRQDLRYAWRMLRRNRAFTSVAVVSLALGIGANTVVFSVLNSLLLRPLAVANPDRVYFLQSARSSAMSYPNYRDLRDRNVTFAGLAAYRVLEAGIQGGGGAERAFGYLASGNYFDVLGVNPALGRFFDAEDDRKRGASPFVVLSYVCWQRRFHGDPAIAGKTIRINAQPYTVIGVAPRGFRGTELFYTPEFWAPMTMQRQLESFPWLEERSDWVIWVAGRLKPGVTKERAEANLNALATGLAKEYPNVNDGWKLHLIKPGMMGEDLQAPTRAFLGGVMALAALVLLAACANLGSLWAARSADRYREIAVRVSIGANRTRIVRQLLTETLLLAMVSSACSCALAVGILHLLSQWQLPVGVPLQLDVMPDWRVLLFALAASTLSGILFGIAPARQAWRTNTSDSLKGTLPGVGFRRRLAVRDLVLALQMAACCVLVMGSVASLRGLLRALTMPAGFVYRGASVVAFDPGLAHYNLRDARAFQRRALEAVSSLPGVTAAGFVHSVPLSTDQSTTMVFPERATDFRTAAGMFATFYDASPGYFRAIGTRLIAGREFTVRDDRAAPRVAIVNETFARKITGTTHAVGRRFYAYPKQLTEIVGVVEDGKYVSLAEEPRLALFRPTAQSFTLSTVMVARSALPEAAMAEQMRQAIRRLDPSMPIYDAGSLAGMLGSAFLPSQVAAGALGTFGFLAALLAITGVYGTASYAVSRQVREIGIRTALGAGAGQVLWSILGRMAVLLALGTTTGLVAGCLTSRLLASVVYQATSNEPLVLAGVTLTMAAVAVAAALGPARRALSLDPLRALRHE